MATTETRTGSRRPQGQRPDSSREEPAALKPFTDRINECDNNITQLKAKLEAVRSQIGGPDNNKGHYGDKKKELQGKLAELRDKQNAIRDANEENSRKAKDLAKVKAKKLEDISALKDSLPFKQPDEIDRKIKELEASVESNALKLVEEKRVLAEISNLKRSKTTYAKTLQTVKEKEADLQKTQNSLNEVNALVKAKQDLIAPIRAEMDKIGAELADLNKLQSGDVGRLNALRQERDDVKKQLDEEYSKLRVLYDEKKKAADEYYRKLKEQRAAKIIRVQIEREAADARRIIYDLERKREDAEAPAFENEIASCNAILRHLSTYLDPKFVAELDASGAAAAASATKSTAAPVGRVVTETPKGAVALKKKSDRLEEESYFGPAVSAKSKGKGKATTPSTDHSNPEASLKLPLNIVEGFSLLKIDVPLKVKDVERAATELKARRDHFEGERRKQLGEIKDRLAKVDAELAKAREVADAAEQKLKDLKAGKLPASAPVASSEDVNGSKAEDDVDADDAAAEESKESGQEEKKADEEPGEN